MAFDRASKKNLKAKATPLGNGCIPKIVLYNNCVKQTNWPYRGDRQNTIMIFIKIYAYPYKKCVRCGGFQLAQLVKFLIVV